MEILGDIDSLGPEVFPIMHICVKASEAKFYLASEKNCMAKIGLPMNASLNIMITVLQSRFKKMGNPCRAKLDQL